MNNASDISDIARELARLLKCRAEDSQRITTRMFGVGVYDTCGRCGGSGEYSYCARYGTTCFKCCGSGKQCPKESKALVARVQAAVDAGKLDDYFKRLAIRKQLEPAYRRATEFASGGPFGVRWVYDDNRADRRDPLTDLSVRLEIALRTAGQAAYAALRDIKTSKKTVSDAAVDAALALYVKALNQYNAARAEIAAHPDFCAARVYRPENWNEFFSKFFVVNDNTYPTQKRAYIAGALNLEDLVVCLANQHNARYFVAREI